MALLGDIIGLIVFCAIAPRFSPFDYYGDTELKINRKTMPDYYKLIYPKWLTLKHFAKKYQITIKKQYRHIRQERKRLTIKALIRVYD